MHAIFLSRASIHFQGRSGQIRIVAIMSQDMPEGRKRAFFAKLVDEQKEVYVKRGRGNKWSAADAGVGCIVYLCVLFVYDVFMDL